MTESETYGRIKYMMPTSSHHSWSCADMFPAQVLSDWAWICAEDVECLAVTNEHNAYRVATVKLYRAGSISMNTACRSFLVRPSTTGDYAAWSFYYAMEGSPVSKVWAAWCAACAAGGGIGAAGFNAAFEKYIGWLAEDLGRYDVVVQ